MVPPRFLFLLLRRHAAGTRGLYRAGTVDFFCRPQPVLLGIAAHEPASLRVSIRRFGDQRISLRAAHGLASLEPTTDGVELGEIVLHAMRRQLADTEAERGRLHEVLAVAQRSD